MASPDQPISLPRRTRKIPLLKRIGRLLKRPFLSRTHATQALYDEILYLSSRTQSLDELLTIFPERIVSALALTSFHILLREKTSYVLQAPSSPELAGIAFPASCATLSRMKRDRRPALFFVAGKTQHGRPDGWQMLATPQEIDALNLLQTQVLLPLEGRTGLIGFATLGRAAGLAFTLAELRFLRDVGPEIGRGFETAQLVHSISEQAVERARAERELEMARQVQVRLLPAKLPEIPGIDTAVAYRSAAQIGGDYYDFFPTQTGAQCIVIADVSGKGVPAALLMASLGASLHALMAGPQVPVVSLLASLNRLLYDASSASHYATLFFCLYDPATRSLTYVNAGHNPPILLRADRSITRLTCGGTVVGLLPNAAYESETLSLAPGDMLIAYTDGVTEAANSRADEWGDRNLQDAVLQSTEAVGYTAQAVVAKVLNRLTAFTAGFPQNDDITLVVLRSHEP